MELVFCTNNQHKIQEVTEIMGAQFHFLKLNDIHFFDDITEPYDTLEANSATKANTVYFFCNKNCFAEDTGLFIEGLDGEPGVRSARYAGEPSDPLMNIEKVLHKMNGLANRNAYFKTVITLVMSKGEWQFEGICPGKISTEMTGKDGFGYDPIFIPEGYQETFAMMSPQLKNSLSHRKKAFDKFADFLLRINS